MEIFNRYYKRYDAWYDRNRLAYLSELEAIRKVLPKKGRGLEIGVGTGRFAASLGIKHGIEPSRNMARIAGQRDIKVRIGHGEKLPYRSNTFDYAAIIITICFVKDPRKVLKESARILKKKGKIILGIVDKDSFLGRFYRRKKSVFYKKAHFFGVEELTALLKTANFGRFSYYQTLFKLPDKIASIEKPQKGFGKGGFVVIAGERI
ncbi:MAG: methyltransferase domain-containing protein [Candidatus Omnitrophica bacterium]|nr:methyltransferase domain-containing protein [Candidatus Omnitrophota bacterium]